MPPPLGTAFCRCLLFPFAARCSSCLARGRQKAGAAPCLRARDRQCRVERGALRRSGWRERGPFAPGMRGQNERREENKAKPAHTRKIKRKSASRRVRRTAGFVALGGTVGASPKSRRSGRSRCTRSSALHGSRKFPAVPDLPVDLPPEQGPSLVTPRPARSPCASKDRRRQVHPGHSLGSGRDGRTDGPRGALGTIAAGRPTVVSARRCAKDRC